MQDRIPVCVIIPVKPLDRAKSRLRRALGPAATEFALAFAQDVTRAAVDCPSTDEVVVVTDDPRAADAVRRMGAQVISDLPGAGIDAALAHAADRMPRDLWHLALTADLPCVTPADLAEVWPLITAEPVPTFISDTTGIGTTAVAQPPRRGWQSHFGPRSRARHRRGGFRELLGPVPPAIRRDVDTPVDLWDADRLGLSPHTQAVLDAHLELVRHADEGPS